MSARDGSAPALPATSTSKLEAEIATGVSPLVRFQEAAPAPLLLRQRDAAELCGISAREFRRWCHRGFAPAPIAGHGGRPLWSRDALVEWVRQLAQQAQRRGGAR